MPLAPPPAPRIAGLALAALVTLARAPLALATDDAAAADAGLLLAALALAPEEREEHLALALARAAAGDCEGALAALDAAERGSDELARRIAAERARVAAWIEARDAYLAELEAAQKPLQLQHDGKRVGARFRREGGELVLERGPLARLSVRALAPLELAAAMPKARFEGREWLRLWPHCVEGGPKWKRLEAAGPEADELRRDAAELYPRLRALAPQVEAVDRLARAAAPADAAAARALVDEIRALLALGTEAECVASRLPQLGELAGVLLASACARLGVAELLHASVADAPGGAVRVTYDFAAPGAARDWLPDHAYLDGLRPQLGPVTASSEGSRFAPGPGGFAGNGEFCWRHALEFRAPLRVRWKVVWEPVRGRQGQVFAFALGMLGDALGRNVRAHELGYLYVDEQDGRYAAVRPKGDATVQLGQTYAMELVHDGAKAQVLVEGAPRAEAPAAARREGRVFLWGHSDLALRVPWVEIEGTVTEESLARARERRAAEELAELGLGAPR